MHCSVFAINCAVGTGKRERSSIDTNIDKLNDRRVKPLIDHDYQPHSTTYSQKKSIQPITLEKQLYNNGWKPIQSKAIEYRVKADIIKDEYSNRVRFSWVKGKKRLKTSETIDGQIQDKYTSKWYKSDSDILSIEHIVPRSVFRNDDEIKSDLHNLILTDKELNSKRASLPFGESECLVQPTCVENNEILVREEIRGFIARSVLYTLLTYKNKLRAIADFNKDAVGTIDMFIYWCLAYPSTELEKERNENIKLIQGNKNPLIDNNMLCKQAYTL